MQNNALHLPKHGLTCISATQYFIHSSGEQIMTTAHLTKTRDGWKIAIVRGVKPLLENIITEMTFAQKRDAKRFAQSVGAKAWNYI
jgi:hypothetical protein